MLTGLLSAGSARGQMTPGGRVRWLVDPRRQLAAGNRSLPVVFSGLVTQRLQRQQPSSGGGGEIPSAVCLRWIAGGTGGSGKKSGGAR